MHSSGHITRPNMPSFKSMKKNVSDYLRERTLLTGDLLTEQFFDEESAVIDPSEREKQEEQVRIEQHKLRVKEDARQVLRSERRERREERMYNRRRFYKKSSKLGISDCESSDDETLPVSLTDTDKIQYRDRVMRQFILEYIRNPVKASIVLTTPFGPSDYSMSTTSLEHIGNRYKVLSPKEFSARQQAIGLLPFESLEKTRLEIELVSSCCFIRDYDDGEGQRFEVEIGYWQGHNGDDDMGENMCSEYRCGCTCDRVFFYKYRGDNSCTHDHTKEFGTVKMEMMRFSPIRP